MGNIFKVFAIILCVLSLATIFCALKVLRAIVNDKRYTFVRNELILIVLYSVCIFIRGILYFVSPLHWYLFAIAYAGMMTIGLLLFWKLAFMYYLSSKQLKDWISLSNDDDPEILLKSFTIKMKKFRRCDLFMTISICLSALFPIVFYHGQDKISLITASFLGLFSGAIIGLLLFSMITLKNLAFHFKSHNPWLLNLQFVVSIIMFITSICTPNLILKYC